VVILSPENITKVINGNKPGIEVITRSFMGSLEGGAKVPQRKPGQTIEEYLRGN
jgi:hypothetical protein